MKLRVAVVGLGHWGPNLAAAFAEDPRCEVAVLCDAREERLEALAKRHGGAKTTTDWREAIDSADAIAVATPLATHREIATAAIAAKKPFLIEKPLADSVEAAEAVARAAQGAKVTALVGHTFLYNPAVLGMKKLIDEGRLGRLYALHSTRVNLGPVRTDADVVWDLAPHDLTILNFLAGAPPEKVEARGRSVLNPPRLDMALLSLDYPGGVWGTARVSWLDPVKIRTVVAVGENGMAVFDDLSETPLVFYDARVVAPRHAPEAYSDDVAGSLSEFRTLIRQGRAEAIPIEPGAPLAREVRHFLDCLLENAAPWTPLSQGVEVVRLLEAASPRVSSTNEAAC